MECVGAQQNPGSQHPNDAGQAGALADPGRGQSGQEDQGKRS